MIPSAVLMLVLDWASLTHHPAGRVVTALRWLGLAGEADQIALNGIDRWIGGVHLQGHHVPWRWDDGTETIVHLPAET